VNARRTPGDERQPTATADGGAGRDADVGVVGEEVVHPRGEERGDLAGQVAGRVVGLAAAVLQREEPVLAAEGPPRHPQTGLVRVGQDRARLEEPPVRVTRDHQVLVQAELVGVRLDLGQARRADEVDVRARVALAPQVEGRPGDVGELDQRQVGHRGQAAEVADLEALDDDGVVGPRPAVRGEGLEQGLLQPEPEAAEVRRVLRLRRDADRAPVAGPGAPREGEHLVERGDRLAVERRVLRAQRRHRLDGPQRAELGQGEVLGEPARDLAPVDGLGGAAVGELGVVGDVGGGGDRALVAHDELPVGGRDDVGLDDVGPLLDRQLVGQDRVLGTVAAGPSVADDEVHAAHPSRSRRRRTAAAPVGATAVRRTNCAGAD